METASFSELKEEGERLIQSGQPGEAARCFRKAVDLVPTSAETWVKLGQACEADGNLPEAIGAFKTAIGLDPHNVEAFFGVGLAYKSNGDFTRAIASFDQVLDLRPNHALAKDELVRTLVKDGTIKVGANDHYGGEQCLERAYKMSRASAETVLPYVEHLINSNQHKKAFDVVAQAQKDAPGEPRIKALAERMDNDPKLAHAKQLAALRSQPNIQAKSQPARPAANPDEVPCPCGASRVMRWATVCPTCNNRIGNAQSAFAGRPHVPSTTWVEVVYYIVSVIWLLNGLATFILGALDMAEVSNFSMGVGAFNAGIALGLLFQVEWVQFIGKLLMILNLVLNCLAFLLALGLSAWIATAFYGFMVVFSGFSVYVIHQMSD